jgi:hypothetical protein
MNTEKFSAAVAFLMLAWFYTTVLIDYAKLFKIENVFKNKEWEAFVMRQKLPQDIKYPLFLREVFPCWLTKLLGCPICLSGFSHGLSALLSIICGANAYCSLVDAFYGAWLTIILFFISELLLKKVYYEGK